MQILWSCGVGKKVLEKRLHETVIGDEMQFSLIPEKKNVCYDYFEKVAKRVLSRRKKVYMCLVDLHKSFQITIESVLMGNEEEKNIRRLNRSVMSPYEGGKTKEILSHQRSLRLKWRCTKDLC